MDYARILQKVYGEPWLITPAMHERIQDVLNAHITQKSAMADSIIARTGTSNRFSAAQLGLTPPRTTGSRVYTRGQLAYVPVHGIIGKGLSSLDMMCGGYSIDQLQSDVEDLANDQTIKRVLFHFDSPGGQVSGVPETAKMIKSLRGQKELFGFTDAESNSASYWLMAQADHIYMTESSEVGSIGVYVALVDRTEALKAAGVKVTVVKAGKFKGAGLPGNPPTAEHLEMIQAKVTSTYDDFKAAVTSGRGAGRPVEDSTMQGQTFIGKEALKVKLADALVLNLATLVRSLS
jgi:signal peptide peptidase SppA